MVTHLLCSCCHQHLNNLNQMTREKWHNTINILWLSILCCMVLKLNKLFILYSLLQFHWIFLSTTQQMLKQSQPNSQQISDSLSAKTFEIRKIINTQAIANPSMVKSYWCFGPVEIIAALTKMENSDGSDVRHKAK